MALSWVVACECVLLLVLGFIVETQALLLVTSHIGAFLTDLHALAALCEFECIDELTLMLSTIWPFSCQMTRC